MTLMLMMMVRTNNDYFRYQETNSSAMETTKITMIMSQRAFDPLLGCRSRRKTSLDRIVLSSVTRRRASSYGMTYGRAPHEGGSMFCRCGEEKRLASGEKRVHHFSSYRQMILEVGAGRNGLARRWRSSRIDHL